jgi:glutathione synthase/RimK-type ligase-like ATP-grasp enzyme
MTVLILGGDDDEHAVHVLQHLRQRGVDTELLDSRWFPSRLAITFEPATGQGRLNFPGGRRLDFRDVKSVYWRNYAGIETPILADPDQASIAQNDARGLFESALLSIPARWVNGWRAFHLHQTKPVQLARVAALGISVPPGLITNDPVSVTAFTEQIARCIFKPVQGGAHARRVTPNHLAPANVAHLAIAPITLQQEIEGTNIRVFVAGDRVLACEIKTDAIDFRDDPSPDIRARVLTPELQMDCRRIARALDLIWTGIDFRLTEAGEYVFLEANPSPMFLGFERETKQPLTEALMALLV